MNIVGKLKVIDKVESIDFLCIGAQKSGTTFITNAFRNHPDIQLPQTKEMYFFSSKGEYKSTPNYSQCNADKDLDWYKQQFVRDQRKTGEISTNYIFDPASAIRIKQAFPDIKIFSILRNPIERAFSQYNMEKHKTGKEKRSLMKIIREEPHNEIIARGFYFRQLIPFTEQFGKDRFKVYLFDDMKNDPAAFFNELFTFIGVDASVDLPALDKKMNRSRKTKYLFIPRSIRYIRQAFEVAGLREIIRALNRLGAARYVREYSNRYNQVKFDFKISADEKAALQELFIGDIENLERLLGRDLSHWKDGDRSSSAH